MAKKPKLPRVPIPKPTRVVPDKHKEILERERWEDEGGK